MCIRRAFLALVLAVAVVGMTAPTWSQSDEALRQQLVAGSPWKLSWKAVGLPFEGTVDIAFNESAGRIAGEIKDVTGSVDGKAAVGPLRDLKVEQGKVSFSSQAGTYYEATDSDGKLTWSALSRRGTPLIVTPQ